MLSQILVLAFHLRDFKLETQIFDFLLICFKNFIKGFPLKRESVERKLLNKFLLSFLVGIFNFFKLTWALVLEVLEDLLFKNQINSFMQLFVQRLTRLEKTLDEIFDIIFILDIRKIEKTGVLLLGESFALELLLTLLALSFLSFFSLGSESSRG